MQFQLKMILKYSLLVFALLTSISCFSGTKKTNTQPNFVVIMCDDVNHDMFGCYGNTSVKTPNIDGLAQKGVFFQTAWNSAMCSPARAEILTGKYATTTGFWYNGFHVPTGNKKGNFFKHHLSFSKILHDNGYKTAVAGKWHIGVTEHQNHPTVGFDEYCMWEGLRELKKELNIDVWNGGREAPEKTARYWHPCIIQNGELVKTGPKDFGPDIYSDFICDFIKRKSEKKEPFLAYYPMTLPHGPYVEVPSRTGKGSNYPKRDSKIPYDQLFVEMVDYVDILVGKIINQLKESGEYENTVIIFTSDNGTAVTAKTRGVERGCHIPFVVSGPNVMQRGITSEICDATDMLPTLVDFAGVQLPKDFTCDGQSLVPFLTGKTNSHKEVIHACIGTTQLLRTKTHLLEVVNPILGVPEGRFYYCGDNHSGNDYVRAENSHEHENNLSYFKGILANKYIGLTKDHPFLQEKAGRRFIKVYTKKASVDKHLHNHKNYIKYDEAVELDPSTMWKEVND